ncbi:MULTISPECIES: dTDP-4-dehydrorhamnose reductase [Aeromonas]|uniref:dTDP-4-dehydrorhamnose reductase n=1 Tax=Aeromonas TaxID=642 RepID=UPI0012EB9F8D|nr:MULTISPECIES: dTDP-4-dehydrorhamnose reductase [Aeromonas]MCQ4054021.1 dTDP-4-dehydrorhamnose reductase [Aeromonas sp. SG16]MVG13264.1 dTDP-4-dehydrorhamnose reductase [Aeromonas jandaei]
MSQLNIYLYGSTGQLGQALCSRLRTASWRYTAVPRCSTFSGSIEQVLSHIKPSIILNAAAFTDVTRAEKEPILAMEVNRDGVARLAEIAKQHNALFVHFSTDYVFDGKMDKPWRESDQPAPLNLYGQSKLSGERAIITSGCRHLIIRTSWLHSPWRDNFLKTMLHLGKVHNELQVVCDQVGTPTSALMLAEVTLRAIQRVLAEPKLEGLYHVAASGSVNWFDYACFIFKEAQNIGLISGIPTVIPIKSDAYPSKVARPLNSQLDSRLFSHKFDMVLPDWRDGVRDTLLRLAKVV